MGDVGHEENDWSITLLERIVVFKSPLYWYRPPQKSIICQAFNIVKIKQIHHAQHLWNCSNKCSFISQITALFLDNLYFPGVTLKILSVYLILEDSEKWKSDPVLLLSGFFFY